MKVLIGAALAVIAAIVVPVIALAGIVLLEGDAKAIESDGGGGLRNVPAEFRPWILKADAACPEPEMTPALLASQLWSESKFKTTKEEATSYANAQGPAQFIPDTWATWGRDDDGNGQTSPWDIGDALMAQGRMMCSLLKQAKASGYGDDPRALALAGYNAGWGWVDYYKGVPPPTFANGETYGYVHDILNDLPRFQGPGQLEVSGTGSGADALRKAATRIGTPYAWGGGTPSGPSTGYCDGTNGYLNGACSASTTEGFDCSSLVQYAYWDNIKLPRVASEQYGATSDRPVARDNLQPGDLLFWSHGGSGSIYHIAMYAGDGKVLHAPRTGKNVEIVPLATAMPERDYYGATRP
ncbi:bifunctional lytic transglycosylase/C40 family peptidase (plasmid) [Streptomyces sp. NBC_00161]|uniref:C40 family peptidase n=1 Tax=Streptomyces sp. NBC_00161 TaxID=2975671 RepID=UPI002F9152B1